MNYFDSNELVFTNDKEGGINTGGISVNSIMMRKGISPIKTINTNNNQLGGNNKVSDLFDNIVVPNWVYTIGKMSGGSNSYEEKKYVDNDNDSDSDDDSVIGGDLHDTLLGLVEEHETKTKETKTKETKAKEPKIKGTKRRINKKGGTKRIKNTKK